MIFLAVLIIFILVGIFGVLNRIYEDIRAIRNWYGKDQK